MDELERRIRAARPMSGNRDLPLSDRAKRELADLVLSSPHAMPGRRPPAQPHRRKTRLRTQRLVGVAAGLVVAIAISTIIFNIVPSRPASAATPELLPTTAVTASTHEVLDELKAVHQASNTPPSDRIRLQSWELNTEVNDRGDIVSSSVEPQWSETVFLGDGSVHFLLTAADPFPGQQSEGLHPAGTILADQTFGPGEYVSPYSDPAPTDPALVGTYLARYAGEDAPLTAGSAIQEISGLLSSVILTPDQEGAILAYLQTLDTLTVAGKVTDRLGRDGIAFQAADRRPGEIEDLLIISSTTGSIIATETLYVGSERTDIASPSVIDYTAWKR